MNPGIKLAIEAAGGLRALARLLGMNHTTILKWTKVPANHILEIERLTGVSREQLRPELYRGPSEARPVRRRAR